MLHEHDQQEQRQRRRVRLRRSSTALISLLLLTIASVGCKKAAVSKPETPWPERPMTRHTMTKKDVSFSLLLPDGVGRYEDPNGTIFKIVEMDAAIFISIFTHLPMPEDVAGAKDETIYSETDSVRASKTALGFEVVVTRPNGTQSLQH